MDYRMQFQVAMFVGFVFVCIAWTRLVYNDGVHGRINRLNLHCKIHAGMIATTSMWAVSIGFYVHAKSMEVIEVQQQTIQNLASDRINSTGENNAGMAQQIAHTVGYKTTEVATPGGTKITRTVSPGGATSDYLLLGTANIDHSKREGGFAGGAIEGRCSRSLDGSGRIPRLPGERGDTGLSF